VRESAAVADSASHRAIEAVFRIESARLIAGLVRFVRDVGLAEELAQDAMVVALEKWPALGIPDNPGAWLMAAAKNRALDARRREKLISAKHQAAGDDLQPPPPPDIETALDEDVGDDLLRLVLISCHPVLSPEARVPFEVPRGVALAERLASVLEVIYLIFNEGYSATAGDDWMRPELCEDALRLGRILAALVPLTPEVHGLVAGISCSSGRARGAGPGGSARGRGRSVRTAGGDRGLPCPGARGRADRLEADRRALRDPRESRSFAGGGAQSRGRGLDGGRSCGRAALIDELVKPGELAGYHLLPSVRGDLLGKLGRLAEAREEFLLAASLTRNVRERALLLARAGALL